MISQKDAEQAVRRLIASEFSADVLSGSKLYSLGGALDTNDVITTIKGPVNFASNAVGDPPAWAFFLDMEPSANWEHPCAYLVALESGAVVMERETAPLATAQARSLTLLPPLVA